MDQGNFSSVREGDSQPSEIAVSLKPNQPAETKVQVALRIRPFIPKEILDSEQKCTQSFSESNQVLIGKDKSFTFDFVFDAESKQEEVYERCAKDLVSSCLAGYNTTILAYGQTGSGKTFTMGSNTTYEIDPKETGIIPRVMKDLFIEMEKRKTKSEFILKVSFLEIYNEEIQDLLDTSSARFKFNPAYYNKNPIAIREEKDGSISVYGAKEEKVTNYEEMKAYLEKGSLQRSTASTLMNETSSRSHAIFTISVEQHQIDDLYVQKDKKSKSAATENTNFTMAKFHFVDLAGSERLKKTGASGSILREGININRGLLALGNVISALTDLSGKINHVPYRESKLTRILQDSLGGNSRTVMIACISPAESNFDESLNTLKYASRARNIKNKPIVNTDPQSTEISQLKQQVFELQSQLMSYKRVFSSNMKENYQGDPQLLSSLLSASTSFSGSFKNDEVEGLREEVKNIKIKMLKYEKELALVTNELHQTKMSMNEVEISCYTFQRERDQLKILSEKYKKTLDENNLEVQLEDPELIDLQQRSLIDDYTKQIEKLKHDLQDKEKVAHEMNKEYENLLKSSTRDQELLLEKTKIIQALGSQLRRQEMQNANKERLRTAGLNKGSNEDSQEPKGAEEVDENSAEDEKMEKEFEAYSLLHKKEMLLVEGAIEEKEELLKSMTQNHLLLEKNLIDEMKQQYHRRALQMELEVKVLEKQRDEALNKATSAMQENDKNKIITTYKQKLSELEMKIKDFKKKERDQQSLVKLVESQRGKIQHLDDEIKRIKTQKLQLHKKVKEEADKFEKWKGSRQRELLEVKKSNIEKDLVISKLKTENKKKDFIYKKKAEELLSKSLSKELFGQIQSETHRTVTPSKKKRSLYPEETAFNFEENVNSLIGEEEAKQLIEFCGSMLLDNFKLTARIEKEEESLRRTEEELESEKHKYAELMYKRDKVDIEKRGSGGDIEAEQNLEMILQDYDLELNEKSTRIESLEAKMDFQFTKVNELTDELARRPKISPEQMLLHNERIIKNPANLKLVLRCLFGKYIGMGLDLMKQQERSSQHTIDTNEMRKRIEDAEQKAKLSELQYEISLAKLTREYERNQQLLLAKDQNFDEDNENENENLEMLDQNGNSKDDTQNLEGGDQSNQSGEVTLNSPHEPQSNNILSNQNTSNAGSDKGTKSQPADVDSPIKKGMNTSGKSKGSAENLAEQNKRLEKMVSELTRKGKTNEKTIENLNRKIEILQMKYDQAKKPPIKEKISNIRVPTNDERSNLLGNINPQTDRSQYSTNTSLSINSSFNASVLNSGRKFDEGEMSSRQKNIGEMKQKGLLNLASLRERRKEEKVKQVNDIMTNRTVEENKVDKPKGSATLENMGKSQSSLFASQQGAKSKKPATTPANNKRNESPKKQVPPLNTSEIGTKSGSQSESLEIELKSKENNADNEVANTPLIDEEVEEDSSNWKCHVDFGVAHQSSIHSVASLGNMLYSSGFKTFKVWSLDAIVCISEIMAHTSNIKSIAIWPEKNLLATTGDKVISLWDLVSLQNVATLKGHKDEIKTLTSHESLLFSGGKGSSTFNSLLVWDLRTLSPIEEMEKDQEIVSMVAHKETLYYGNQNHQIRRINLSNFQSMAPFEPSHQDSITSLAVVQDKLISASKDKTMNLWDLNHYILNMKHSWTSKNYVSALGSNTAQDLLYSGSKGGVIKIWNTKDEKFDCIGTLNGHTQAVSSICKLYDEYETMFATASSDKHIKLWKPLLEETSQSEQS